MMLLRTRKSLPPKLSFPLRWRNDSGLQVIFKWRFVESHFECWISTHQWKGHAPVLACPKMVCSAPKQTDSVVQYDAQGKSHHWTPDVNDPLWCYVSVYTVCLKFLVPDVAARSQESSLSTNCTGLLFVVKCCKRQVTILYSCRRH